MEEDTQALDEVVVIGYGTMRKKDLTGSVVQIDPGKIADQNPVSVRKWCPYHYNKEREGRQTGHYGASLQQNYGYDGYDPSIPVWSTWEEALRMMLKHATNLCIFLLCL